MAVVELSKCLLVLLLLYALAAIAGLLASIPMIAHVYPQSECLLFASQIGGDALSYGHHSTCNIIAYANLIVIAAACYLFGRALVDRRQLKGHHPSTFEAEYVRKHIFVPHCVMMVIHFLLTILVTAGYIDACNNLYSGVSTQLQSKLNVDPYDTRGEEIKTRYEDDYRFHRYTNKYGNAFGAEYYTIRITCRSILTDPEIHQKLHQTHYEQQSRYYGYWYGQDLYVFDPQFEASKANSLIEASLAGNWLTFALWLAAFILMIVQKYFLRKKQSEQDRISMNSAMMSGPTPSSLRRGEGSVISGRASSFQRGGSMRGSDRSIRSSRRDFDDLALTAHLGQASSYGRKEVDDMFINQIVQGSQPNLLQNGAHGLGRNQLEEMRAYHHEPGFGSQYSKETGYISDGSDLHSSHPLVGMLLPQPQDKIYITKEEVETEIF